MPELHKSKKEQASTFMRPGGVWTLISLVSLILIVASLPLLHRSLWFDELALFFNYPLPPLRALFSPLPFFNQAATPLYSLLWGVFGALPPLWVRIISCLIIIPSSLWLVFMCSNMRSWKSIIYASFAIVLYWQGFFYISEMKHYALEIIACLIAVAWFLNKPIHSDLEWRDIGILSLSLLTGISTLPLALLSLFWWVVLSINRGWRISVRDLSKVALYSLLVAAYYFNVKHITLYQLTNSPDVYRYPGLGESLGYFKDAALSLLTGPVPYSIVLLLLIPLFILSVDSFRSDHSRKLLTLTILYLVVYLIIFASGMAPVRYTRHVLWMTALLWVFFVNSLEIISFWLIRITGRNIASYVPLVMAALLSTYSLKYLPNSPAKDFSVTHNNAAIDYLESIPSQELRFWIAGEPAFHFYKKYHTDLAKHKYADWAPTKSSSGDYGDPKTYDSRKIDVTDGALAMLADVKPREPFLIFASHYDKVGGWFPNHSKALHKALAVKRCSYYTNDFEDVHVYHVTCPAE